MTGGSNGIGLAIARAFVQTGAEVLITGPRPKASDYEHDLSAFRYRTLDVADHTGVDDLAESLDTLDVLVDNAGATFPGGLDESDPAGFERSVGVNLIAAHRMAVGCRPKLAASKLEGGASIINMASMSSYYAVPMVPGYGVAKAGIVQITKNLAVSWVADTIRVNAIAPAVLFLCSTAAGYITGQALAVDGGDTPT